MLRRATPRHLENAMIDQFIFNFVCTTMQKYGLKRAFTVSIFETQMVIDQMQWIHVPPVPHSGEGVNERCKYMPNVGN